MSAPASSPASAEKDFGQPIIVVNKAGAGGQIGFTEIAARAAGRLHARLPQPARHEHHHRSIPSARRRSRIDSFIPIDQPGARSRPRSGSRATAPTRRLADLIDAAKKNPGKISACTTGILSDDHLAILMMQEAAKVRVPHRPFRRRRAADHRRAGRPCRRGLRQCRRRLQARAVGRGARRWPSPTTSARSSCPRCRPPRSWASRR